MAQMITEEEDSPGGMSEIIERIDGYIQNPKLVTVQTLKDLKSDLMDMEAFMDGEETEEPEEPEDGPNEGLIISIGKAKRGIK